MYDAYTWIFALSVIVAFAAAFGIGANDVANSFASSVGAKALTMVQAIIVAGVCEFAGAALLGAGVTDTIKSGIAKVSLFSATPDLLLYGMFCVMIAAAFWDNMACHLGLPVSTTHTTVGAVVGMALVLHGGPAVQWHSSKAEFPYYGGITAIVSSWVISPLMALIVVFVIFGLIRTFVLRAENSFKRAFYVLPLCVIVTFFIITLFILQTGNKNGTWGRKLTENTLLWIGAVVAGAATLLTIGLVMPFLYNRIMAWEAEGQRQMKAKADAAAKAKERAAEEGLQNADGTQSPASKFHGIADIDEALAQEEGPAKNPIMRWWAAMKATKCAQAFGNNSFIKHLTYGANYKIHDALDESSPEYDPECAAVWENAETFDPKTERLFRYLQIFSAMVMSFAHGSNDIANAMGPFSAVYYIWVNEAVPTKSPVPEWILVLGGASIVTGLALYGYKIMRVLGVKSVKVTNARGFCLEISTAITVVTASRFGLPVSTTQVLCGAIMGIGLFEGKGGVNWRTALKIVAGWVCTLFVAGLVAALFTAYGVFTPNKIASQVAVPIVATLNANTATMIKGLNATALSTNNVGLGSSVMALNSSLTSISKSAVRWPWDATRLNNQTFALYNPNVCMAH